MLGNVQTKTLQPKEKMRQVEVCEIKTLLIIPQSVPYIWYQTFFYFGCPLMLMTELLPDFCSALPATLEVNESSAKAQRLVVF